MYHLLLDLEGNFSIIFPWKEENQYRVFLENFTKQPTVAHHVLNALNKELETRLSESETGS